MRIDIINLGCSKNLVDSESLMTQLTNRGLRVRIDPDRVNADLLIVNTCGFIHDAREESVNILLDAIRARKQGRIGKIIAMGCLVQRYREELLAEMPEIDGWFGVDEIPSLLGSLELGFNPELLNRRIHTTPRHYAYLKVSEGCSRKCAFCAIPAIRGRHISRAMEDITTEARFLASNGARELILIAQDLSFYGRDLYRKPMLVPLLERLEEIPGIDWIRLHYAYPLDFNDLLIKKINASEKICKYLDIPFQHISNRMLRMMRRGISKERTLALIHQLRAEIPRLALRTTLLVGHPGETERDFTELADFVEQVRFDRLGVFTYSPEEGTYADEHYQDTVPEELKQERLAILMGIQQKISSELNQYKVDQELKVLIDRKEGAYYIGRSQFDSPEVDPEILVTSEHKRLRSGSFYQVKITGFNDYDLFGTVNF
ncbi:MAG: 30S ribosomal protein S12 methylthiotransferase RimO [Bacteroidales bacterium]